MILHNMIIKDEGRAISPVHIHDPPIQPFFDDQALAELTDSDTHFRLRNDLVEHLDALDLPHLEANASE